MKYNKYIFDEEKDDYNQILKNEEFDVEDLLKDVNKTDWIINTQNVKKWISEGFKTKNPAIFYELIKGEKTLHFTSFDTGIFDISIAEKKEKQTQVTGHYSLKSLEKLIQIFCIENTTVFTDCLNIEEQIPGGENGEAIHEKTESQVLEFQNLKNQIEEMKASIKPKENSSTLKDKSIPFIILLILLIIYLFSE